MITVESPSKVESIADLRALLRAVIAERDEIGRERDSLRTDLELRNAALDVTSTHFMITDMRHGTASIVYVNRALANDHGYRPDELLGRAPSVLVPIDLNPDTLPEVSRSVASGAAVRANLRSRRRDGTEFWCGVSLTPIYDSAARVTHFVAIGADITIRLKEEEDRRRLQEQLYEEMQERERMAIELRLAQKLESVGRLAAGVAHEINTPIQFLSDSIAFLQTAVADLEELLGCYRKRVFELASSAGRLEILEELAQREQRIDLAFLTEEIPKSFERTQLGVERVAAIVRAMKEFAHPDAAEQAAADVNRAIQTTLTVAHNEYKYHAQIVTELGDLPEVICNIGELNQVFLNLIVNAAHAIQESGKDVGDGCITIGTRIDNDQALVWIADNGCGIPPANLEKIFDPFFTTKEVGRGTGQGLAIARSIIVEKHGGAIEVQSIVGVGTRFTLRLPIAGKNATHPK